MDDLVQPQPLVEPLPNLPLLRKVLDHIDAHPEEWNQANVVTETACGTAYCIAGHALMFTEGTVDGRGFSAEISQCEEAASQLGLTEDESRDLFSWCNTREQVQRAANRIAARAGERL